MMEMRQVQITEQEKPKKRGRKKKGERRPIEIKEKDKFFVDVSKDKKAKELILESLKKANKKTYGSEITLKDLVVIALPKLNQKDIEKAQEDSMSEMEKVEKSLSEYNKKNNTDLTMGEFLVKKLNLN